LPSCGGGLGRLHVMVGTAPRSSPRSCTSPSKPCSHLFGLYRRWPHTAGRLLESRNGVLHVYTDRATRRSVTSVKSGPAGCRRANSRKESWRSRLRCRTLQCRASLPLHRAPAGAASAMRPIQAPLVVEEAARKRQSVTRSTRVSMKNETVKKKAWSGVSKSEPHKRSTPRTVPHHTSR
jgi:hypothetical protein